MSRRAERKERACAAEGGGLNQHFCRVHFGTDKQCMWGQSATGDKALSLPLVCPSTLVRVRGTGHHNLFPNLQEALYPPLAGRPQQPLPFSAPQVILYYIQDCCVAYIRLYLKPVTGRGK